GESEDDKAFEENRRLRNLGSVEYIRIMSSEKSNANSRHTSKYYSGRKNFKKFQKKASQK
uniref:DNA repair and telomere maintenance protein nbs1 n=1 Tax=Schizosaccharomyces pombe (strain 972 / ATCC 24843) TaxID=284812 RepID=UPI0002662B3D|nr:Chain C, DNA repair and telomere maintenance protein nbs1 [Schizosaccharomyces pombe 972h-]4FBW_D Chain D, DNA repair and telomere maintenance protein nbs1 [Schizosaccharomyces pombe 972h-]